MTPLASPKLAVYIVWIPVWEGDLPSKARFAALRSDDTRIVDYMAPDIALAHAFTKALSWGQTDHPHASGDIPWDVAMLYPPEATWSDAPTAPAHWASPVVRDNTLTEQLHKLLP